MVDSMGKNHIYGLIHKTVEMRHQIVVTDYGPRRSVEPQAATFVLSYLRRVLEHSFVSATTQETFHILVRRQ